VDHSTYHRGQAAAFLWQVGATVPSTDLVVFTRPALRTSSREAGIMAEEADP
jgi:uncharacterized damage-inducible protein DinB